jgi:hypothetical protein
MNQRKEQLIVDLIDMRIQNLRADRDTENWVAEVLNFGWVGYDKYSDDELLAEANELQLMYIPTLEEIK